MKATSTKHTVTVKIGRFVCNFTIKKTVIEKRA